MLRSAAGGVEDPNPAGRLAARLDGQAVAGGVPGELGGEGRAEPLVGFDRVEHPDRRAATRRAGGTRCRDPRASPDRRASRRRSWRSGSMVARRITSGSGGQIERAAGDDVDGGEARRHAVVTTDEDEPSERSRRERLGRQVQESARAVAVGPEGEPLALQGAGPVEPRIDAIPDRPAQVGQLRRDRPAVSRRPGRLPSPTHRRGVHGPCPAPSATVASEPSNPRAITPGPTRRTHRDSNTIELLRRDVLAGGGRGRRWWQGARIRRLSGWLTASLGSGRRRSCARLNPTSCVTPRGREAGEIPAQSRYGERPSGSASPVAGHTVHARTFERKVGRTVRLTG